MVRSPDRNWLVAVEESPREGSEPENRLVAFSLTGRREPPVVVAGGHDFVSSPCFSPDGTKLAFLAWEHPDMPWDSTRLFCVGWSEAGITGTPREIAGGPNESILQPRFSPSGRLTFVSDRDGFWNLYQRTDAGDRALCSRQAEFAMPHWVFGISNYDFVDEDRIPMQLPGDRWRSPGGFGRRARAFGSDSAPLYRNRGGLCRWKPGRLPGSRTEAAGGWSTQWTSITFATSCSEAARTNRGKTSGSLRLRSLNFRPESR